MIDKDLQLIKEKIRTIPNWPKKGIMFRDITTLLKDKEGFKLVMDVLTNKYDDSNLDYVVGIESRGFIFGAALADRLNLGFIPIRKPGKLPGKTISVEYELEYGKDKQEIHVDAINSGDTVLLVDDLLATGGSASAAVKLIKQIGGNVLECCFIIDLPDLGGRKRLEKENLRVYSLVEFEGD